MVPYTRLYVNLSKHPPPARSPGTAKETADLPATYEGHETSTGLNDFRMRKYEWQCEASDYNKGGDEAAEVNGSRALAGVGGEIITPAMREERVGKRSDYEGQCCSRAVPY